MKPTIRGIHFSVKPTSDTRADFQLNFPKSKSPDDLLKIDLEVGKILRSGPFSEQRNAENRESLERVLSGVHNRSHLIDKDQRGVE